MAVSKRDPFFRFSLFEKMQEDVRVAWAVRRANLSRINNLRLSYCIDRRRGGYVRYDSSPFKLARWKLEVAYSERLRRIHGGLEGWIGMHP